MRRVRTRHHVGVLLLAAALTGCGGTGSDAGSVGSPSTTSSAAPRVGVVPDWVVSVDSRFADPQLLGLCEDADYLLDLEVPGAPTPQAAVVGFVRDASVLASEGIEVTPTEILFDGVAVGTVTVTDLPLGGFAVERAEWCYPGAVTP
jgi:hypothetical protein